MNIQHKKSKKPLVIILIAVAVIAVIGYLAVAKANAVWPFPAHDTPSPATQKTSGSTSNSNDDEKNSSDPTYNTSKDQPSGTTDTPSNAAPSSSASKQAVNVSITSVGAVDGNIETRAYVSGVIEGGGTCTATLTKSDGTVVTGTSDGFVDATSTQCRPIEIPKANVPSGDYTVTVTYGSSSSTGTSPSMKVTL